VIRLIHQSNVAVNLFHSLLGSIETRFKRLVLRRSHSMVSNPGSIDTTLVVPVNLTQLEESGRKWMDVYSFLRTVSATGVFREDAWRIALPHFAKL